eukprot:scaffold764_cov363-Pavlova_lutheri.AAC.7
MASSYGTASRAPLLRRIHQAGGSIVHADPSGTKRRASFVSTCGHLFYSSCETPPQPVRRHVDASHRDRAKPRRRIASIGASRPGEDDHAVGRKGKRERERSGSNARTRACAFLPAPFATSQGRGSTRPTCRVFHRRWWWAQARRPRRRSSCSTDSETRETDGQTCRACWTCRGSSGCFPPPRLDPSPSTWARRCRLGST